MKYKRISRILVMFLAFAFISSSLNIPEVKAANNSSNSTIIGTKEDVAVDKIWRVRFNNELDSASVNENNAKIWDYGNNKYIPVEVSQGIDKHYVNVRLKSGTYNGDHYNGRYDYGKKYRLEISKDMASKATVNQKSKKMLYDVKMDFTTRIENPYPGIPTEDGTVIMNDKAYSAAYLEKNSQIANDIVKNGEYEVYFIYSEDGQRIRKLLGDEYHNSNFKRSNEVTYYDADGSQQIYQWNDTAKEYKLLPASVFADITPGSKNNIVNVNVKNIRAVPGAVYYKLKHSNNIKKIGDTTTLISSNPLEEISILSSNETVLAKGVLNVSQDNSKYYSLILITNTLGTTAGNSNNNGSFVMTSDFDTIYRNTGDNKTMYKKDLTGSIDHQISLDNAQYINALGQWVYYSNYSDGAKIYKVKKDGTVRTKVCDDKATYIMVSGSQIIYSNHTDKGRLYTINTDGTGGTVDSAGNVHGRPVMTSTGSYDTSAYDEVSYINVVGDWIYYSNVSDRHKTYVINKDGTARRKVNDEWSDCVQVAGDWVYYASATGVLSKVRKDGTSQVVPIRGKTTEVDKGYHLNVVGDWVYYSNAEDGGKLYKIKTDGSGEKYKLCDLKTEYINIIGDWIYIVTSGQSQTYMIPIDTNGKVSPKLITKNSLDSKIVKVEDVKKFVDYDDVTLPLKELEAKYLPPKVPALMNDDTYKEVTVSWDTANVKFKDGVYTYIGTILGYGQKIKLDLNIPSEMLNDTNKIIINNNGGPNDTLEVIGTLEGNAGSVRLKAGDLVFVYSDKDCTKLLGKGTVGADKNALISRLNIDSDGASFYLTVKRIGKGESKPTEIKQLEAPIMNGEVEDNDEIGVGLDGRDFTISKWIQAKFTRNTNHDGYSIMSQELYILPGGNALDMKAQQAIASSKTYDKNLSMSSTSWVGTKEMYIKKDSKGTDFKDGKYDVFVATGYSGSASPDSSGFKPIVEGHISTAMPKQVTVLGEKVPDRPSVKNQIVAGEGRFVLDRMPKDDEVIWLIPEEEEYKVKGWRTEDGTENPFKVLMYASKAILINKGEELISPQGLDSSIANYRDRRYKVFFVNKVGASESSVGMITVDNKKPRLLEISRVSIAAGEELTVKSSEKGTAYLVGQGTDDNNIDSLETAVRTMNGLKMSVDSNGNRFNSYDTQKLQNITPDIESKNYKIVLVDAAGNISGKVKDVSIWRSDVDSELYPAITRAKAALEYLNGIDEKATPLIPVEKTVKNNLPGLISSAEKTYNDKIASEKNIQDAIIKMLEQTGNITSTTGYENDKKQAKLKSGIQSIKLNNIIKPKDVIKLNTLSGISTTVDILSNPENVVQLDSGTNTIKLTDNSKLPTEMKVCKVKVTLKDTTNPALTEEKEFYMVINGDNPVKELSLSAEGDNYIDISGGKLLVKAAVKGVNEKLPVDFENITFDVREVDKDGKAITNGVEVDKNYGIMTAKKNGKAYVKATIKNNDGTTITSAELEIVITNQMLDLQNAVFTLNKDSSGKGILTIKNLPENNDISIRIYKTTNNDTILEATPDLKTNITRNNTSVVIRNLSLDNESLLRVQLTKPNMNDPEPVTVAVPR